MRARRARVVRQDLWPGFVDALASLLMVVIFLLSVFAVAQHFLSEKLSGREEALAAAEARFSEADQARHAAQTETARLGKALAAAEARIAETEAAVATARSEGDDIAAEAAGLEDALAGVIERRNTLDRNLERTQAQLNAAGDQIALAEQQIADRTAKLVETAKALETAAQRIRDGVVARAELERRIKVSAAERQALERQAFQKLVRN